MGETLTLDNAGFVASRLEDSVVVNYKIHHSDLGFSLRARK